MHAQKSKWIEKLKDKRGIPIEDAVMLYSHDFEIERGCRDFFIGSLRAKDAYKHNHRRGGYGASVGAVFTVYQHDYTDAQRIIDLLCNALQILYINPTLSVKKVVNELRKIDFFYYGAFPQVPGDHTEPEE